MVFQKTRGKFIAFLANILMLMRDAPRALIWLIMRFISRPRAEKAGSLKSSYIRFCFLLNYLVGIEKEI